MSERPIYVGIIGYGKVGSGTYKTLLDNQESIDRKVGRPFLHSVAMPLNARGAGFSSTEPLQKGVQPVLFGIGG